MYLEKYAEDFADIWSIDNELSDCSLPENLWASDDHSAPDAAIRTAKWVDIRADFAIPPGARRAPFTVAEFRMLTARRNLANRPE
jgi:hypothetical protein